MIEVAESLLTEEFIVRIYEYLTMVRTRELVGWQKETAESQSDGYISCLEDLFGVSSDKEAEIAADEKRTIFNVIDRIMSYVTPEIAPYTNKISRGDLDFENWSEIMKIVRTKVRDYAVDHFDDCVNGIKSL